MRAGYHEMWCVCARACVLKEYKHDFSASSSLSPFTFFPLSLSMPLPHNRLPPSSDVGR